MHPLQAVLAQADAPGVGGRLDAALQGRGSRRPDGAAGHQADEQYLQKLHQSLILVIFLPFCEQNPRKYEDSQAQSAGKGEFPPR